MRPLLTIFILFAFSIVSNARTDSLNCVEYILVDNDTLTIDSTQEVQLKALQDDVVIKFKTTNNSKPLFYYYLNGYDEAWQQMGLPVTRYTNLKGGVYDFEVFEKSDTSKRDKFKIRVEATVNEERWFIPSLISFIALLVGGVFYFWSISNYRQKFKLQTIRNKIASDLHDEVGSNLSSIAVLLNSAERKIPQAQPELKSLLNNIRQTSSETILNLRDTVWMINPDNDTIEKLFEKMRSFALKVLTPQDIDLNYKNNLDLKKPLKVSMDQRYNVYMIYRETINNIIKHAEATEVNIIINPDIDGFSIEISDNGKGFDDTQKYEGNGLLNFQRRAKDCFIDLTLKSTPQYKATENGTQSGTTLKMIVPEL